MGSIFRSIALSGIALYLCSCGSAPQPIPEMKISPSVAKREIDTQGHRGCRGLYPENTVPGFLHALDLGVKTLELDVVITADSVVICSHEPWFSHEITTNPDGTSIEESEERNFAIYRMPLSEVQTYDVGLKPHQRFPDQRKLPAVKPTLQQVIAAADAHAKKTSRPLPYYNIETKTTPEGDAVFHPSPIEFSELLMDVIRESGIENRCTVQSFDPRTLRYIHERYPGISLVFLVENQLTLEENLKILGFTPDIYSPDYTLVTEQTVLECRERGMQLIPWTINEPGDMKAMLGLGVDGIITDYPNRLMPLVRN